MSHHDQVMIVHPHPGLHKRMVYDVGVIPERLLSVCECYACCALSCAVVCANRQATLVKCNVQAV